jgi:hypothetical protein
MKGGDYEVLQMKGGDHEVLQMKGGNPETVLEVQTEDLTQETTSGRGLVVLGTKQARALEGAGKVVKIKSVLKLVVMFL